MVKIVFNLPALASCLPALAVLYFIQGLNLPRGVDFLLVGLPLFAIDFAIRKLNADPDMSSAHTGGQLMYIPVWAIGGILLVIGVIGLLTLIPLVYYLICGGIGVVTFVIILVLGAAAKRADEKTRKPKEGEELPLGAEVPDPWKRSPGDLDSATPAGPGDGQETKSMRKVRKMKKVKRVEAAGSQEELVPLPQAPSRVIRKRCPRCRSAITITTRERPIVVGCQGCGKKFKLRK